MLLAAPPVKANYNDGDFEVADRGGVLIHGSRERRVRGRRNRSPAWLRRHFGPATELTWSISALFYIFRGEA